VVEDHVPAKTSMLTLGDDGDVGDEFESLLSVKRLQPDESAHARAIAAGRKI